MRGRKSTFDEERFTALLKSVAKGKSLTGAAEFVGLPRRTVHRWIANDPELRKRVLLAKAES